MIILEKAKKALELSESKAKTLGITVSTVILDEHGTLIAMSKMDGALEISPRFAFTKAYTPANLGMSTSSMAPYATEGKPYFGVNSLFSGDLTTISGGVPIMINGKRVGGIGVEGSADTSQDEMCALEAQKAFSE